MTAKFATDIQLRQNYCMENKYEKDIKNRYGTNWIETPYLGDPFLNAVANQVAREGRFQFDRSPFAIYCVKLTLSQWLWRTPDVMKRYPKFSGGIFVTCAIAIAAGYLADTLLKCIDILRSVIQFWASLP